LTGWTLSGIWIETYSPYYGLTALADKCFLASAKLLRSKKHKHFAKFLLWDPIKICSVYNHSIIYLQYFLSTTHTIYIFSFTKYYRFKIPRQCVNKINFTITKIYFHEKLAGHHHLCCTSLLPFIYIIYIAYIIVVTYRL